VNGLTGSPLTPADGLKPGFWPDMTAGLCSPCHVAITRGDTDQPDPSHPECVKAADAPRPTASTITAGQLDALYAERDRLTAELGAVGSRASVAALEDITVRSVQQLTEVRAERDRLAAKVDYARDQVLQMSERAQHAERRVEIIERLNRNQADIIRRVRGLTGRWAKRTDQLKRAAELIDDALDGKAGQ